jgi:uncharacterized protein related to proFAR isomerase
MYSTKGTVTIDLSEYERLVKVYDAYTGTEPFWLEGGQVYKADDIIKALKAEIDFKEGQLLQQEKTKTFWERVKYVVKG